MNKYIFRGRALNGPGEEILTKPNKTPNAKYSSSSDRLWVLRSMVERERARPPDKVPKL